MDVRAAGEGEVDQLARIWYDGWQDAHAQLYVAARARERLAPRRGFGSK